MRRLSIGSFVLSLGLVHAVAAQGSPTTTVRAPGIAALRTAAVGTPAERGDLLARDLGCAACHADPAAPRPQRAPDLSRIGARASAGWLRAYLAAPQRVRPGSPMPDVLAPDPQTRRDQVEDLVHFLCSDQRGGPLAPSREAGTEEDVERGRALFDTIGCAACHEPSTSPDHEGLERIAHKTTVAALSRYLLDPLAAHPSGKMPDFGLDEAEARALSIYLLRDQIGSPESERTPPITSAGLAVSCYEVAIDRLDELPDDATPTTTGFDTVRADPDVCQVENDYVLRFRGQIVVDKAGPYEFALDADDGARLRIDGKLVVDNDGVHPKRRRKGSIELRGNHAIAIDYFQASGGAELELLWRRPEARGPSRKFTPVPLTALRTAPRAPMVPLGTGPFDVDEERAARGGQLFDSLGCAACHEPDRTATRRAGALPSSPTGLRAGCLADTPRAPAARFALDPVQRAELRAAFAAGSRPIADPSTTVRAGLAWHHCYACHERDGVGVRDAHRDALFTTRTEVDLGDEGRVPPRLDGVGDKLRPRALRGIVREGRHHVRGHTMNTRMPRFSGAVVDDLLTALAAADPVAGARRPTFVAEHTEAGRRLVGNDGGFACVTCHAVNGHRAAALDGVDLAHAHARLRPEWLVRYLRAPQDFAPNTRMPAFWSGERSPFADVLDGKSRTQVDAVWSYLSLGASMRPPAGVQPHDDAPRRELAPDDAPIVHRTFFAGVGPWAIAVGYPERIHTVYDARGGSLAMLWRGRFFDGGGVASGRTDAFFGPLGDDVLALPAPAFAALADLEAPWPPRWQKAERHRGGDFHGYRLDAAGRPTFRHRFGNDFEVEEQAVPEPGEGGGGMVRRFRVECVAADRPGPELLFLAWRGPALRHGPDGSWTDANGVTLTLRGLDASRAVHQRSAGGEDAGELRLRIGRSVQPVEFSVEMQW